MYLIRQVKKVLDPTHCGGLEEGDRLIAIDGIDLRGLSHTQVVQILKDFPLSRDASLTIQRVHSQSFFNKKFSPGSNDYSDSRVPTRAGISPRSKTPTADLGRSRPRLRDNLPERPKTPVFDGHFNNGSIGGMYNGPISPNNAMYVQNQSFLGPDRRPMSSSAVNHNEAGGDLNHPAAIRY